MLIVLEATSWQGCESEKEPAPVDCNQNPVVLELISVQDSDCALKDGSIEVAASGGSGTYSFTLGSGAPQPASVFSGLSAGLYDIQVVDDKECSAALQVNVKNKDGVNITFNTTAAGCNTSNGTITVSAVDGTEPYQYKLDQGTFTSTNSFSGLGAGDHQVVAKDATGCEVSQAITINSGVSFTSAIKPIIEGTCAVNGCHNGTQFPDFRVFKNIHDNASSIRRLTQDRTMPQEGSLTQTQIDLIACWVDDGALNN